MSVYVVCLYVLLSLANGQIFRDIHFEPKISASCIAGFMDVVVHTDQPFKGIIHAKDYRTPECSIEGEGSRETRLRIPLLVSENEVGYCGIYKRRRTDDRSFPVAVRVHNTLELAEDKVFVINCGKSWFRNANNETLPVKLDILKDGSKTSRVVLAEPYTITAKVSKLNPSFGIKVKSCFSFTGNFENYTETTHIDDYGCPVDDLMSEFIYNSTTQVAEATIYSMFKFPDSNVVHIQCDVAVCPGGCEPLYCDDEYERLPKPQARVVIGRSSEEKVVAASTTAYVIEPGQDIRISGSLIECEPYPHILLYICIALAVAFVILLIAFICLCASMTCSCTNTEVIEKEPSIIEDYDPYKIGWSGEGSHYGSRFSLNGKGEYMSGGSTLNSYSTAGSDHYAIVHSQPGSSHYSASKQRQSAEKI